MLPQSGKNEAYNKAMCALFVPMGLCQWHAFGVRDKEEQQQWIALLRNEMVTASIASAIAMGGNELVGR